MGKHSLVLLGLLFLSCKPTSPNRHIGPNLPTQIEQSEKFVFYFHGGVVTTLGDNAVNQSMPEWGPYEFTKILDSLASRGFHVISERRKPGIPASFYVDKLAAQIDTLLRAGVDTDHILTIGASAGWDIVVRAAAQLANSELKVVMMGGCWPDTYKDYENLNLRGHFLSIVEATDPHGSCIQISDSHQNLSSFQEIKLNTGLSHGFIYKGYKEWIDPIMNWFHPHTYPGR